MTVGFGISPKSASQKRSSQAVTAGEEFHLALKIHLSENSIFLSFGFVNRFYNFLYSCFKNRHVTENFNFSEAGRKKNAFAFIKSENAVFMAKAAVSVKRNEGNE